jgi:hypothetical protein
MSALAALDMMVPASVTCPSVDGAKSFIGGTISPHAGEVEDVHSPILNSAGEKYTIGRLAQMHEPESLLAVEQAHGAWRYYHDLLFFTITENSLQQSRVFIGLAREFGLRCLSKGESPSLRN